MGWPVAAEPGAPTGSGGEQAAQAGRAPHRFTRPGGAASPERRDPTAKARNPSIRGDKPPFLEGSI